MYEYEGNVPADFCEKCMDCRNEDENFRTAVVENLKQMPVVAFQNLINGLANFDSFLSYERLLVYVYREKLFHFSISTMEVGLIVASKAVMLNIISCKYRALISSNGIYFFKNSFAIKLISPPTLRSPLYM